MADNERERRFFILIVPDFLNILQMLNYFAPGKSFVAQILVRGIGIFTKWDNS